MGPGDLGVNGSFTEPARIPGISSGTSFTISIDADDLSLINGFDVRVGFDTRFLDATNVDYTGCIFDQSGLELHTLLPEEGTVEESPGVVRIAQVLKAGATSGSGCLSRISFTAIATPSNSLLDIGLDNDLDQANDLSFIVLSTEPVPHDTSDALVNPIPEVFPAAFFVQPDKREYGLSYLGESVQIALTGTNPGATPASFVFSDSCSGFFFTIHDSAGSQVFTDMPSPSSGCPDVSTTVVLQPGETRIIRSQSWDQKDSLGRRVHTGTYLITAILHDHRLSSTIAVAFENIFISSLEVSWSVQVQDKIVNLSSGETAQSFIVALESLSLEHVFVRVRFLIVGSDGVSVQLLSSLLLLGPAGSPNDSGSIVIAFPVPEYPNLYKTKAVLEASLLFLESIPIGFGIIDTTISRSLNFRVKA